MNWTKIDLLPLPKDGTEFLVRNGNQGGVKSLVYWNIIHNRWESKGIPVSLQDTHWLEIPEFMPESTYDCDKCGKPFVDVLYHEEPQLFLCPSCKKEWGKRDLLDLLREYRYAYNQYEGSSDKFDLDEMNNKQNEIIEMFERTKKEQAIINFITRTYWENPENAIGEIRKRIAEFENLNGKKDLTPIIVKELKELVNRSGFAIPTSVIGKIIEENEDLQTHAATSDFCSAEWKNDFERVKIILQKIYDAVNVSEDQPSEKVLVIKSILEDYYGL